MKANEIKIGNYIKSRSGNIYRCVDIDLGYPLFLAHKIVDTQKTSMRMNTVIPTGVNLDIMTPYKIKIHIPKSIITKLNKNDR
jgi:hypothetical protein